jgi:hypothetical protein
MGYVLDLIRGVGVKLITTTHSILLTLKTSIKYSGFYDQGGVRYSELPVRYSKD